VLQTVSGRAHAKPLPEADSAILASIQRSSSGTAALWDDNNVTSITIGGGSSVTDITVTAGSGNDLTLGARGSTITLNESGDTSLNSDFTATSIIGGLNELMAGGREVLLSTTTAIDGTATGTTNLFTVPSGKTIVVTRAIVRLTSVATFTSAPIAGIGVAAGEDDIISPQSLSGLNTTSEGYVFVVGDGSLALASATDVIKLGIDTGAVAGTYTIAVDLFGFEVGGGSGGGSAAAAKPYILLQDQTAGNGGTFTSGSWQTRILTTTVIDTDSILVSLSSNQFTLPAGTYDIHATAPAFQVDHHQTRLRNVSDSSTVLTGSTCFCRAGGVGQDDLTHSILVGRFTITAQKTFELQHQCATTKTLNGFGTGGGFGTEVFSEVELIQVDS
jgi:hypothetical protein